MKNFYILMQTLIDNEVKPNSMLCFCRDLYEYKKARYEYFNAPSKAIKKGRYCDYHKYQARVKDWLKTFRIDAIYKPEDFNDE